MARDSYLPWLKEVVNDFAEEAREYDNFDDFQEYVWESVDGMLVYYTDQAMVALGSDNDGAYFEDFGAEGAVKDGGINWGAIAHSAMMRDVWERLDRDHGINDSWFTSIARVYDDLDESRKRIRSALSKRLQG